MRLISRGFRRPVVDFSMRHTIVTLFLFLASAIANNAVANLPDRTILCESNRVSERDIGRAFFLENLAWQRPVYHGVSSITVNLSLSISAIREISEQERTVKFKGHVSLSWIDQFHTWKQSFPHNCIDYVVLKPSEKIWIPDIAQPFNENKNAITSSTSERIRIHSDGRTSFNPGGDIYALCQFDLSNFPFDYQKCVVRLESWTYTSQHLKLILGNPPINLKQYTEHELWRLLSTKQLQSYVYYNESDQFFDRLEFTFLLKRKPAFYVYSIILPNLFISLAVLSIFALPMDEVMRLQVAFTCLVVHGLFQLVLMNDLPRSSDNYPLLSSFIDLQIVYVGLVIAVQSLAWCLLKDVHFDNDTKLEASMSTPLKLYNSVCVLAKVVRIVPPFAMFINPSVPKRIPRPFNLSLPQQPIHLPISERMSSNSMGGNFGRQEPPSSASERGSFWRFCPFTSNAGSVSRNNLADCREDDELEPLKPGSDNHLGRTNSSNNSNNNTAILPSSSSPSRLLIDFRRKLFRFYAQVIDRLLLLAYLVCIVLTPIFMAFVSASSWREVSK